ncbi:DUF6985 domain-containing protein [Acetivibrio cellulolyticus]|uniref:DUF6985 domain-containing protein n=1 Tax=Acetivibrio cellulolyticus TaxID=35830 RepID=UPI0001E30163|nr:hypothetical protein [Acetivibrio cellulolyticus]
MLKNVRVGRFGLEGELYFELFKKDISFSTDDEDVTIEYIEKCATYLNSITGDVINFLCEASIRYCNDVLNMIGEEPKKFKNTSDVLELIYPSVLIVPMPENGNEPVIHLELNCDWEEEHGMEWIIRDNTVLYVGSFNGEDPWGDYSIKESWNYA